MKRILIALALTAYFVYFAYGALRAHFAPDDMMNIGRALDRGLLLDIRDNFTFWSSAYRPLGALVYFVMFRVFGLNPMPYRILALALMAANLYLTYVVALLVTKSRASAFPVAVLAGANYEMVALYYNTSQIYDVLAYSFTLLLLFGYIRIRT